MQLEISFATPLHIVSGPPPQEARPIFTFTSGVITVKGENMSATMQVKTYATVSVQWKDAGGNIVKVDGPTKWESTDPTVLEVTVATGNAQIANLYAPGPVGNASVHATADADLGEGVKAVTATLDVTVVSGEAVGGEITFSQSPAQGPQARQGRK